MQRHIRGSVWWFACACGLLACGGNVVSSPDGGDPSISFSPDRGGSAGQGGATGVGGGTAAGGSTGQAGSAGCSMPVGTPAFGCPMVLAPQCDHDIGWGGPYYAPDCTVPFTSGQDPEALAYVDLTFGPDMMTNPRLLRVANVAECALTGNGWYFDDPQNPTELVICPDACACAKQDLNSYFSLAAGCWGNGTQAAMSPAIACPQCNGARPKSCGSTTGGFGYGTPVCDFPLSYNAQPAFSNVKYCVHCAHAGPDDPTDGYVYHVPTAADCDKVVEGWWLDESTQPPTVHVCPSTCSCAMVNGATFMLEEGCPRLEGP